MQALIRTYRLTSMIWMLLVFSVATGQNMPQGNLVIAGGDLEDDNRNVYSQLIELAGGAEKASFAVIPSSSGIPVQSYLGFRDVLVSYGINPNHIFLVNIAMMDDDSTADVNESTWNMNGDDPALAELVGSCAAVWFTGGNQSRTVKTLFRPDGSPTAVLEAVWEVFRSGGVVGGSSAGAAIMSDPMIGGGNSLAALTHGVITGYQGDDFPEGDGLLMLNGLGFFPCGTVDQHFEARSRLGRLAIALMDKQFGRNLGFGIDENTALIYYGSQNICKVAGASGVTILNTADARIYWVENHPCIENLSVSYLTQDDTFDCNTGIATPAAGKKATRGNEYYDIPNPGQAGILSGYTTTFRDLITIDLIDNKGADTVSNLSFYDQASGFLVTLSKTPVSEGYYTNHPDGEERYTVINVRMDIVPVQVTINSFKE